MLVLSMKPEDRIFIGENVVVTCVKIKNGKVAIGFEAPKELPIVRSDAIDKESKTHKPRLSVLGITPKPVQ